MGSLGPYCKTLGVQIDPGVPTQAPVVSRAGLVIISILLGLHVLSLAFFAIWASWFPKWTSSLDSFAMMRIGGVVADELFCKLLRT